MEDYVSILAHASNHAAKYLHGAYTHTHTHTHTHTQCGHTVKIFEKLAGKSCMYWLISKKHMHLHSSIKYMKY